MKIEHPYMTFTIESKTYGTFDGEREAFRQMKANHKPDSIVVCRDWRTKEILDELRLDELI